MTPERLRQIEALFHAVRERPATERRDWLEAACKNDIELREQVEALLRQDEDRFLFEGGEAGELKPPEQPGALAGRRLGPYTLGPLIGAGGMGEVYRARDSKLRRDVAIKILAGDFARQPARVARFAREARALAALNHPNIGAIFGFEETDSVSGLVLELLEGDTLADRLRAGPLPVPDALAYAVQIADALAAAHAKGIVHRDLKPANIKITATGVKVLDFGLAKTESAEPTDVLTSVTATRDGVVLGTAPYMSPEQARGLSVDQRTDVWAFGCVLFEMLTGRRAFPGESTLEVLASIVNKEPDLGALPAATPRSVRSLIGRCLVKDSTHRLDNIAEARDALAAARHTRDRRRYAVVASVAAVVVVSALVWTGARFARTRLDGGMSLPGLGDATTLGSLIPQQLTSSTGFDGWLTFSPGGQSVAFASDRSGTLEIYVQGLAPGSTPSRLTNTGRQNVEPAWSPDGQFIAYHDMAGDGIWIVPARGGTARKVVDSGSRPAWSPDSRRLVYQSVPATDIQGASTSRRSTIWTVDIAGDRQPTALTLPGDRDLPHLAPRWTPDGRSVIFEAWQDANRIRESMLKIVPATGGAAMVLAAPRGLASDFVIAPNGRAVYYVPTGQHTLWSIPLSASGEVEGAAGPTGLAVIGTLASQVAISPDGRHLGWTAFELTTDVWSAPLDRAYAPRADARALTSGAGVRYSGPTPSSDGRLALTGISPGTKGSIFVIEPSAPPRQLTTDSANHGVMRWLPDEKEIAIAATHEGTVGYFALDPETGRERPLFPDAALPRPHNTMSINIPPMLANAFSKDLARMAMTLVRDGVSNIWVVPLTPSGPSGAAVQRTFEKEGGEFPSWSPDGRWIGYQCSAGAAAHLCMVSADQSDRIEAVGGRGQNWIGGWLPDSDRMLFSAERDAVWNVAWVSRSTGQVRMLTRFTDPHSYVRYPAWDQANRRVVFDRGVYSSRLWIVRLPPAR